MNLFSNLVSSTVLTDEILGEFQDVFDKMGIEMPCGPFDITFTLEDVQKGETYFIDDAFEEEGSPLKHHQRRVAVYLEDNYAPAVHVRYCKTLKTLQRKQEDDRFVAKLPTRDGFIMQKGPPRWLEVCGHCLKIENREAARQFGIRTETFTSESILALILAEFVPVSDFGRSIIDQIEARSTGEDSLTNIASRRADGREYRAFSPSEKKRASDNDIIAELVREEFRDADTRLLKRLANAQSIKLDEFRKRYGSDRILRQTRDHFKDQPWGTEYFIKHISSPMGPLLVLSPNTSEKQQTPIFDRFR